VRSDVDLRLVQFDPAWLEPEENLDRMCELVEEAAGDGSDLIVFPELSNVGYVTPSSLGGPFQYEGSEADFAALYRARAEDIESGPYVRRIGELAGRLGCTVVVGLARRGEGGQLLNSAVVIGEQGLIGVQDKLHIPPQEKPFFAPGKMLYVFDTAVGRIGLGICYNCRFPEMSRAQAIAGAEICLVVYAGSNHIVHAAGVQDTLLYRAHVRAQENGIFYAICNRVGTEGTARFAGHSVICGPNGRIIAVGDTDATVVRGVLSAHELKEWRRVVDVLEDRRSDVRKAVVGS
jgi:predicted amidohydrolase